MQDLRIALVQMQSVVGETPGNLAKIKKFVSEAGSTGVNVICFPELAVHGYSREFAADLAEKIPGYTSEFLSDLARRQKVTILAGIIEKAETAKPYITQLVCFPDGSFDKYRKTHLGASEKPYFSPGEELPVFSGPQGNFAIQICWDLHFPEVSAIYSLNGAEIIFAPHASPTIIGNRREIWLRYLTARAYDNSVFLASCNLLGENGKGSDFCGGLLVIDPKGQVLAEDFSEREKLLIVDLPRKTINKIRYEARRSMRDSFYLKYRRPELYKDLLKK
ncbi:MAG: nitrilase family protein [Peptococcaceae bacterium]